MADWDTLISKAQNKNPQMKPKVNDGISIEKNHDFEFGDALESKILQKTNKALAKAEVDPVKIEPIKKVEKVETSGPGWYNIQKTELTEEQKRDWQLLRMRSIFRKHSGQSVELPENPPDFIQFGTIQDNPLEGQKGRLTRKQRAPTLAESLVKDSEFRAYLEESYDKLKAKQPKKFKH